MSYIKTASKITDDASDNSSAFDGAFILLFVFTLAVRLFQSLNTRIIEPDSCTIIDAARTFGNLSSLSLKDFAVNVHPLFPFLMALAGKCGIGYEAAGTALSVLFGTLTLFPVYLMSERTYGRRVGRYSAFLFAVHPYLFINAANLLRDSMTIFFMVMTFFIAWKGFQEKKDRYLVLSGFVAAAAYLTKAEGLFCIVAVFLYIWMRDPRRKEITVRERMLSTICFASISLIIVAGLITIFSLKTNSFSLSVGKPLGLLSSFSPPGGSLERELAVLGGVSAGLPIADMALAFFFVFIEAIFTVYVLLLGMNLLRLWTKEKLLPSERYCLFIIVTLLLLDFLYFNMFYALSRRYFLSVVVLLMGFMGYGARLLQQRADSLFTRKNVPAFVITTLTVLFIAGIISSGLIKGSSYWKVDKVPLKITGHYILSHSGAGKTILTDDARVAYYADGTYRLLTEDTLIEATGGAAGDCPYDFIVFCRNGNLPLYEKYNRRMADSGFIDRALVFPPGSDSVFVLECLKGR